MKTIITAIIIALVALTGAVSAVDQSGANAIGAALTAAGYANEVTVRAGSLGYNVVVADLDANPANGFSTAVVTAASQISMEGDPDSVSLVGVVINEGGQYSLHAVTLRGSEAQQLAYLANTDFQSAVTTLNGKLATADRTELPGLPASLNYVPAQPAPQPTYITYPPRL